MCAEFFPEKLSGKVLIEWGFTCLLSIYSCGTLHCQLNSYRMVGMKAFLLWFVVGLLCLTYSSSRGE
jgi:hypothetical protein